MSARARHEAWLGMVAPSEGVVVSIPVLLEAGEELFVDERRRWGELHAQLEASCSPATLSGLAGLVDLQGMLVGLLGWDPKIGGGADEAGEVSVVEGQPLAPSFVLEAGGAPPIWVVELPPGLDLDRPEQVTGPWRYPPQAKFDRLLRGAGVEIGLLTNREVVRLIYAPSGGTSGYLSFRIRDMLDPEGAPILSAFVGLLHAERSRSGPEVGRLAALLASSRQRQVEVTAALARQVLRAAELLLGGLEVAAARAGRRLEEDGIYASALTGLLRVVVLLYAEARGLAPVGHPLYARYLSVLTVYERLRADADMRAEGMRARTSAWAALTAIFRATYFGVTHGSLRVPARGGSLFDPGRHRVLELPVDDATVAGILDALLIVEGQRLSYRSLDVEQLGGVYEGLIGYQARRLEGESVCASGRRVWIGGAQLVTEHAQDPRAARRWLVGALGLSRRRAQTVSDGLARLADARRSPEPGELAVGALEVVAEVLGRGVARGRAGELVIAASGQRHRTSSHYTPRSLTQPVVARTLAPVVAALGPSPRSEQLLALRICDPAMGSGALLVEVCRQLADHLVAAWAREGRALDADAHLRARREIAGRCLYGVDKNPLAARLAKLSLWLLTLSPALPFTFVDRNLGCGDSLVGLSLAQLRAFDWAPAAGARHPRIAARIDELLARAGRLRGGLGGPAELEQAAHAQAEARLIADVLVGGFFAGTKARERARERRRRAALIERWFDASDRRVPDELREQAARARSEQGAFHWPIELPEVFAVGAKGGLDAIVTNPPFLGGSQISGIFGGAYRDWLRAVHPGAHGNADLSAHFVRRADTVLASKGTIGVIATNTIGQGDTRTTGLRELVGGGYQIYDATVDLTWPAAGAAVSVSLVHLARGHDERTTGPPMLRRSRRGGGSDPPRIVSREVAAINSRLRGRRERADPVVLASNAGLCFLGAKIYGQGFILSEQEREALIVADPDNAARILPYLGGEQVNSRWPPRADRWVIDFGRRSLEEARRWPALLELVERRVKPERDRNRRDGRRRYWWRFGETAPALYAALDGLPRCLVNSQVTRHLAFAWQSPRQVFAHTLCVYASASAGVFAVLQSRVHAIWAWTYASTMRSADLRYTGSDCFETFPFPRADPRAELGALAEIGERLADARDRVMRAGAHGLTRTYHQLVDARCQAVEVAQLRRLHIELDRRVLEAYGWTDLVPPAYEQTAREPAREAFEAAVLDRLFELNAVRARAQRGVNTCLDPFE